MTRDGTWVSSPDQLSTAAGVGEALPTGVTFFFFFFLVKGNQFLINTK